MIKKKMVFINQTHESCLVTHTLTAPPPLTRGALYGEAERERLERRRRAGRSGGHTRREDGWTDWNHKTFPKTAPKPVGRRAR